MPLYQRLVVMFRLREHRDLRREIDVKPVYIKLFKNIPQQDIDMLLPATRFRLTLLDRGKIILPTLSGIAIAVYKIVQGALLVAFAGLYGVLAVLGLVGGTVGYGVKSFLGYLRTKEKYQLSLTRSLYFQNLDNNAGVLYRLLDEAEEQECLEADAGVLRCSAAVPMAKAGPRTNWTAKPKRTCSELLGFAGRL